MNITSSWPYPHPLPGKAFKGNHHKAFTPLRTYESILGQFVLRPVHPLSISVLHHLLVDRLGLEPPEALVSREVLYVFEAPETNYLPY